MLVIFFAAIDILLDVMFTAIDALIVNLIVKASVDDHDEYLGFSEDPDCGLVGSKAFSDAKHSQES